MILGEVKLIVIWRGLYSCFLERVKFVILGYGNTCCKLKRLILRLVKGVDCELIKRVS